MFISRLEMSGFKSFASRTAIDFRNGVMAVVGPNGCGKTNIVDAVRWVLGEQRTAALRAEKMDSVIFNGAAKRKPLGLAEVTLTIENDRGVLPSPYTQIELARRLTRAGESEYLLNRTSTRLRDIQDLFADTGFSHSAYSIIELAMVEGIINGPAESRRSLFEEAAGVSKFKSRRTAAERRLEQTEEALERIKDVYAEVEKSYAALKRQSGKAKRYQSLTRALQLRLLADLSHERLDLALRRSPTEARLKAIESEIAGAEADVNRLSTELLKLEADDLTLEGKVGRSMEALKRVERREAELDGELALVRQRKTHLSGELADADRRRGDFRRRIERSGAVEKEAEASIEDLLRKLAESEGLKQSLEEEARRLSEEAETARRKLAAVRAVESDLGRRIAAADEVGKRSAAERERLAGLLASAQSRVENLTARRIEAEDKSGEASGRIASLQSSSDTFRAASDHLTAEVEEARRTTSEAHAALARAGAQSEAARSALVAHRSREGYGASLPKSLRELGEKSAALADRIDCLPEHRAALAAALKPILEAVDCGDFREMVSLAGRFTPGESAALRLPGSSRPLSNPPLPERVEAIPGPKLILGDGELAQFLRGRLGDLLLVPDRESLAALAVWASASGLRLATPEGELLEPDGVMHAGRVDPEAYRVGWLKKLGELQSGANGAAEAKDSAQQDLRLKSERLGVLESSLTEARRNLKSAEDELAGVVRAHAALQADLEQTVRQIAQTEEDVARLTGEIAALPECASGSGEEEALATRLVQSREELRQAESEVASAEQAFVTSSDARVAAAAAVASSTEQLHSARRRKDEADREGTEAARLLGELEARLAAAEAEAARSDQAAENLQAQVELTRMEKRDLTLALDQAKDLRSQTLTAKQERSTAHKKASENLKQLTAERGRLETDAVTIRERLREIDRRLGEDAGANPETISERTPEQALAEIEELGLADLSLDQIKVRIQSLGPVNMLALEELEEVEQRYKFLTDQRKDLQGGIELLTETIDRINHEARRRFRETFEKVDANFQDLFRTLFEGGEARITLEGSDPLEADIRIWATPSGKKMQGLGMLSGGEKTLTAISLLFAVYLVRPSPFCILDEVDAPLDDVNVARFNRMIRRFSKDTQFLVVTHNKRTMEAADSLIGVTIADDGTSQLVTVKLEMIGDSNGSNPE